MFKNKPEVQTDFDIFAMYDSKVQAYDMPMFAINQHDITRQILNVMQDDTESKNKYKINAEDYSLFKIGSYSKKEGKLFLNQHEHIANMHDLRAISQQKALSPT